MTKLDDGVLQLVYLRTPYQFYNSYIVERYGMVIVYELVNSFLNKSWPIYLYCPCIYLNQAIENEENLQYFFQHLFSDANQLLFRYVLCLLPVSVAVRLLGSRVRIPLRAWLFFSCVCCVFCRCDGLITGGVLPGVCVCVCVCVSVYDV